MLDQRPQNGGGGDAAERADEGPVIRTRIPLPAAVASGDPGRLVEQVLASGEHSMSWAVVDASSVIAARSVSDEAIHTCFAAAWIASRSLSSGTHSRDPLARNDGRFARSIIAAPANSMTLEVMEFSYRVDRVVRRAPAEVATGRRVPARSRYHGRILGWCGRRRTRPSVRR